MAASPCSRRERPLSRRQWLAQLGAGFGSVALSALLAEESPAAANPLAPRAPHYAPRVKRVIMLFMFGGPSHLDTFDPKPLLRATAAGRCPRRSALACCRFPIAWATWWARRFEFRQHGESGIWMSSLFPHLAQRADDLCVINSMHCSNSRHGGAVLEWHTGQRHVRPAQHGLVDHVRPGKRESELSRDT